MLLAGRNMWLQVVTFSCVLMDLDLQEQMRLC